MQVMGRNPCQRPWAVILFRTKWPSPSRPWPAAPAGGLPRRLWWISARDWSEFSYRPMITCIQAAVWATDSPKFWENCHGSTEGFKKSWVLQESFLLWECQKATSISQGMWMKASSPGDIPVPWLQGIMCVVIVHSWCPSPKETLLGPAVGILLTICCCKKSGRCSWGRTLQKSIATEPDYCIFKA